MNTRWTAAIGAAFACLATGCGTFGFGSTPTPVFSSVSTSSRGAGTRGEIAQIGTRVRVRATHGCDVVRKEERTAGHQAEIYHPLERLNAVRRHQEQEEGHLGPITEGIFRGADDADMQSRSFSTEIRRGATPWWLGAAAVALVETTLKANARIDGKMTGEHHQGDTSRRNVACFSDDPSADVEVALRLGEETIPLGVTDRDGHFGVDLADVLADHEELAGRQEMEGEILIAGNPSGRVRLDVVSREVALRRVQEEARTKARGGPGLAARTPDPSVR